MSTPQEHVDADAVRASRDNLHAALDSLATAIEGHKDVDVIGPKTAHARAIGSLREDVVRLGAKFAEDRLLRLGVVGQVKAGKSSLLNLLLFGGKEVLPRAATPMTASLTHITKSDRDEIKVEYYTKEDWAKIEEGAKEYRRMKNAGEDRTAQVFAFVQASHELVEMAAERGLQVGQHLGTTSVETVPASDMNDKLTSLVGADGKLTPLVKSVAIRCAHQGVPDLDIVDTPGLNDPISSRSHRAEKMLVDCDAVLLLSYAGQFMDSTDLDFFKEKLPQEGISNCLIIGSKFDSALIDQARKFQGHLQRAQDDTKESLLSHAADAIERLTEDAPESTDDPKIVFTSAMCSKLATTPYDQWDHQEKSIFDSLRRAYPDWLDPADESASAITEETKETLTELGNQQQVDNHLDELRRNKVQHIFASNQQTVEAKRAAARKEVDKLLESLRTYREKINSVKVEEVDKQMRKLVGLEQRLADMIGLEWHGCMQREMKPLTEFRSDLRKEAKEAREELDGAVSTQTKTKTKRKKKKGLLNRGKRFIGMDSGWETKTKSYEVRVLNTAAVEREIEGVSTYITDKLDVLREQMFTDADFVRKSQEALGRIVANELGNEAAEDYDVDMLRASLRDAIGTVAADARAKLERGGNFQPKDLSLSSRQVEAGLEKGRKAIRSAVDSAIRWIRRAHDSWSQIAQESEDDLAPLAVAGLKKAQEQLKKDIEDRAFKTRRIDSAVREIEQCQAALSGGS